MKSLPTICIFCFLLHSCVQDENLSIQTIHDNQIRVFGQVQYGHGNCAASQNRLYTKYDGELLFITKSSLQSLLRDTSFGYINEDGNIDFEKFVGFGTLTQVQKGAYSLYLLPGEYFVIPHTKTYLNTNVTFATGSVVLGRDFEFFECEK